MGERRAGIAMRSGIADAPSWAQNRLALPAPAARNASGKSASGFSVRCPEYQRPGAQSFSISSKGEGLPCRSILEEEVYNEMPSLRDIFDNLERPCDKFDHYFPLYERHLYL